MGTINLLDEISYLDKKCSVVFITTDKVYENNEWTYGYREIDPLGGFDPYSSSKAAAELAINTWRLCFSNSYEYNIKISSARAGNVIGGGDWAKDRIIPDAMRALSMNKAIKVRNKNSTRPWQHVLEPLFGYLSLAKKFQNVEILWASVREPYNYLQAKQLGCHIITVPPLIIEKIEKFGKTFEELTKETVKAFLVDSKKSKFKI